MNLKMLVLGGNKHLDAKSTADSTKLVVNLPAVVKLHRACDSGSARSHTFTPTLRALDALGGLDLFIESRERTNHGRRFISLQPSAAVPPHESPAAAAASHKHTELHSPSETASGLTDIRFNTFHPSLILLYSIAFEYEAQHYCENSCRAQIEAPLRHLIFQKTVAH